MHFIVKTHVLSAQQNPSSPVQLVAKESSHCNPLLDHPHENNLLVEIPEMIQSY